jgi:hypothetical protein
VRLLALIEQQRMAITHVLHTDARLNQFGRQRDRTVIPAAFRIAEHIEEFVGITQRSSYANNAHFSEAIQKHLGFAFFRNWQRLGRPASIQRKRVLREALC